MVATALLGAPGAALAQEAAPAPTQDFADAKRLHEAGRLAEQRGDWQTACEQFRASVERAARPANLFKVGVCLRREQRYVDAWRALQRARALDRSDATRSKPEFEAEVEQELALIPTLRIDLPIDPIAWTIAIDDEPLEHDEVGRLRPVNLGEHLVRAEAPGYEPAVLRIVVEQQLPYAVTIPIQRLRPATLAEVLPRPTAAARPPSPPVPHEARSRPSAPKTEHSSFVAQLVVGGAGLVSSVLGIVLRVDGQNDYDNAKSTCNNASCNSSNNVELGNAARSRMLGGTIVAGVGVSAMAGAGIWWALTPKPRATPHATRGKLLSFAISTLPNGGWAAVQGEL